MSPKYRVLYTALFFYLISFPLTADSQALKNLRIAEIQYNTDGLTSPNALDGSLNWDFDRIFSTAYELNDYLQQKRQFLSIRRCFDRF